MLLFASFVDLDQFFLSEEAPGGDVHRTIHHYYFDTQTYRTNTLQHHTTRNQHFYISGRFPLLLTVVSDAVASSPSLMQGQFQKKW